MASENTPALGISQVEEYEIKSTIEINGEQWKLKRHVEDASVHIDHLSVNWLSYGCRKVFGQPFYACWIKGVVLPTPNSLEIPTYLMYVGFNENDINMSPKFVTMQDLSRMHIYGRQEPRFAEYFINNFLGIEEEKEEKRAPISSQPPKIVKTKKPEVKDDEQS